MKTVVRVASWLKTQERHMFADPRAKLMGTRLQDSYLIETQTCGRITKRTPLPDAVPGWRLYGWAWDVQNNQQGKGIVVSNAENRIIGWGRVGYPTNLDVAQLLKTFRSLKKRYAGWKAYMRHLGEEDQPFKVDLVEQRL